MKRKLGSQSTQEPSKPESKDVRFIGSAQEDLRAMPDKVRVDFGFQLWLLQNKTTPQNATPFEGSRANEVMKLSERHDKDAYRCVYAAKFEKVVYVLHVFQKKSRSGIATPQSDIDLVYHRMALAKAEYEQEFNTEKDDKK